MSNRVFSCCCQKCGLQFEFTGSYERFNDFLDSENFVCKGGHKEDRSPRAFVKVITMSEPCPVTEWKPTDGLNYVDILDTQLTRVRSMQMDHLGAGLYIDRRTLKKYDYEEDAKGYRHYFEVPKRRISLEA
jgi:hypothetical protein